jgi:thioredoxin reductase (NADPH)
MNIPSEDDLIGKNKLEKTLIEDRASGEVKEWTYDGIFVFVGLTPNSDLIKKLAETDKAFMTQPGLFAAGDVRAGSSKQAAVAVGEGASAALAIREYLKEVG